MLRRIIYEDWQLVFPIVALAVASAIFLAATWRAARMKSDRAAQLARLPFDQG